jgi:hypothetical protein
MVFKKTLVIFFLTTALCGVSMAARLYQVGGSAGWTSMGDVDYHDWAANKKFHVGDTLVFHHNYRFHDVKQVTRQDFKSCNVASPIASYYNHHGYDSLTLNRLGHFYFISAFPDHCQAGQKIDILVTPETSSPTPPPLSSPISAASATSSAPSLHLSWALSVLAFCLLGFAC